MFKFTGSLKKLIKLHVSLNHTCMGNIWIEVVLRPKDPQTELKINK